MQLGLGFVSALSACRETSEMVSTKRCDNTNLKKHVVTIHKECAITIN